MFYSILKESARPVGHSRLRFKDVLKQDLKGFGMECEQWTALSQNRDIWRAKIYAGKRDESENLKTRNTKHHS